MVSSQGGSRRLDPGAELDLLISTRPRPPRLARVSHASEIQRDDIAQSFIYDWPMCSMRSLIRRLVLGAGIGVTGDRSKLS